MKSAILALVLLLTVSKTQPERRVYLPSMLRDTQHIVSALGPCPALFDCIQGYP